ncbi:hypothetical protein K0L52_004125 [Vibrio fluvialis]|nr:hypothetical protein [Vibrio fluvialis]
MKTLNIDWLTCDSCGGQGIEVETEKGNENWLFSGDQCKCNGCGATGMIEADGENAWFEVAEDQEQIN